MIESEIPGSYFERAYRDYRAQNPNRKLDHYLNEIQARAPDGPMKLLDIGCGLELLARAEQRFPSWDLFGSDIDSDAVSSSTHLLNRAEVVQASAVDAPFPDRWFDVITAWDVIEHVPDRASVAEAVSSMLRPGGLFAFVVPVYDGFTGPAIRRMDRDPTHVHKDSRDVWLAWAGEYFTGVEWHGITRYLFGRSYLHVPSQRFRRHTPAIFVSARLG